MRTRMLQPMAALCTCTSPNTSNSAEELSKKAKSNSPFPTFSTSVSLSYQPSTKKVRPSAIIPYYHIMGLRSLVNLREVNITLVLYESIIPRPLLPLLSEAHVHLRMCGPTPCHHRRLTILSPLVGEVEAGKRCQMKNGTQDTGLFT